MKKREVPKRMCLGCTESKEKKALLRIVSREGKIFIDAEGKMDGRGAYLCKDSLECLEKAFKKRSFERTFGVTLDKDEKERICLEVRELGNK